MHKAALCLASTAKTSSSSQVAVAQLDGESASRWDLGEELVETFDVLAPAGR